MPSNKRKVIRVFCDESRQTKARYMVLAGIWISQKYIPEYEDHHKKTIEVTFKVSVDSDGGGGPHTFKSTIQIINIRHGQHHYRS